MMLPVQTLQKLLETLATRSSLAAWLSAIGTVLAVIVALFGETFWAWYRRPKLDLSIAVKRPDCVKTFLTDSTTGETVAPCYYFRLAVRNIGKRRAESVEVYTEMLESRTSAVYEPVVEFPPMDLRWSHIGRPLQDISP
jgi:hypothetical protein